jgi:hypothetical protein
MSLLNKGCEVYFLYKLDDVQVEMSVSEDSFFKVVGDDFSKMIAFFNDCESHSADYKIHPETTAEAKWMIEAYCKLNYQLPKWLINYFKFSFEKILDGEHPSNALGLTRPPHRPRESHLAERNRSIHSEVSNLMAKGIPLFDSALDVSAKYHLHESNIQKIYSAVKKMNEIESSFDNIDSIDF